MIDRLIEKIRGKENPTVVGLDPTVELMPPSLQETNWNQYGKTPEAVASMFETFNRQVIDGVRDLVPAVKLQIAMYEAYGIPGIRAYCATAAYAKKNGLVVIGDIKRGDIGSTAAAYATHIGGIDIGGEFHDLWQEDAVTVNPYFGSDGIQPFLAACDPGRGRELRGLFLLVRTSNPGSAEIQELLVEGEPLYLKVADLVSQWGRNLMGVNGYSQVGAVVGATWPEQGKVLRQRMPHTFFLVPGYGAQGGRAEDLAGFFDARGEGAIVNSSRGIIGAWKTDEHGGVKEAARRAARMMRDDLARGIGKDERI